LVQDEPGVVKKIGLECGDCSAIVYSIEDAYKHVEELVEAEPFHGAWDAVEIWEPQT